jgi:ABC-type amino acid transport system permease subunit
MLIVARCANADGTMVSRDVLDAGMVMGWQWEDGTWWVVLAIVSALIISVVMLWPA